MMNKIRKVVDLEVYMKFLKIECKHLSDKLDFVDLAVVWDRGDQTNESKGYELNYIEIDSPMNETFRRISGFKQKGENVWEEKKCVFKLVQY
jgi:hypothetical protein